MQHDLDWQLGSMLKLKKPRPIERRVKIIPHDERKNVPLAS